MIDGQVWHQWSGPAGAPPMLLVHGSMDRSAGLLKLSRRLDDRFRVVRVDRRGYGRSRPHPGPFTMDGQLADVESVLDGRPAVLVGHSFGGNVVLAYAARHPALVRAAIVYETPMSWFDWWPGSTAGSNAVATRGDPGDAAERFMRRMLGDARWERLPERSRRDRRAEGGTMVDELTDLRDNPPWHAHDIVVPTLVMRGSRGRQHHRMAADALSSMIAGAELAEIPGAGHPGPTTHPDEVAAAIGEFLERRAPAAAATGSAAVVPDSTHE